MAKALGKKTAKNDIYRRIKEIIESARNNIGRAVNFQMVRAYWLIGKEIVEVEQRGKGRAEYGKKNKIPHTLCAELGWSHYRILMRIDNSHVRSFYEIECAQNNWSSRELERQKGSLLYERLALSKDKKGLLRLARKGQETQVYEDIIKDPYILEFTGLESQPSGFRANSNVR